MINFKGLLNLQQQLFLYMVVGGIAAKIGIITKQGRRTLTDLVIDIVLPCNIIASFCVKMNQRLLGMAGQIIIISFIIQILQLILSRVLYPHITGKKKSVMEYGTICSNAGYLGNPVVEGIYGTEGLLYASLYLIPVRIFLWSAGLACYTSTDWKKVGKRILTHPCIIAVEIGLLLMLTQFQLPTVIDKAVRAIGSMTSVLSMVTIGAVVAGADFRTVINKDSIYYSFVRLVLIPLCVLLIGKIMKWEGMLLGIGVVLAGMPAGATVTLMADKYGSDAEFASKCMLLSTVASMVTIPVLCLFLS